jgi:cytochrome c-type protein NapC
MIRWSAATAIPRGDGLSPSRRDGAADIHGKFLVTGEKTCIDCHKGIAHELPDMTGIEPGWRTPPEMRDRQSFRDNPRDELARYLAATGAER